jgi:hypothetical protein
MLSLGGLKGRRRRKKMLVKLCALAPMEGLMGADVKV